MSQNQAIIRKTQTESVTFVQIPSKELRKHLMTVGFEFKSGQWVRSHSLSEILSEEAIASQFGA